MEKSEGGVDLAEGDGFVADSKEMASKHGVEVKEARPVVSGGRSSKKPTSVARVQVNNGKALKGEVRHNGSAITVKQQKPEAPTSHSLPSKGKSFSVVKKSSTESRSIRTNIKALESRVSKGMSETIDGCGEGCTIKPWNQAHDVETHDTRAENSAVLNDSNGSSVEIPLVRDNNSQSLNQQENTKSDEDAHSATSTSPRASSAQRRSSGSGFAFRLDERAEKRKEFLQKLEEKTQAKEAEQTDLQARSKENQEAEIKKLRKTLTFKATPMPTFYKEPGPPKAELKKIPVTRAVSPKLGRPRPLADHDGKASSKTSHSKHDGVNGTASDASVDSLAAKKATKKHISKSPSQKSTKPVQKSQEAKVLDQEKKTVDTAEVQKHLQNPHNGQSNGKTDEHLNASDSNAVEENEGVLSHSNSIPTHEVSLMGHVSVVG